MKKKLPAKKPEKPSDTWEDPFSYSLGEPLEDENPVPPFSAFTLQDHDPLTVPYPDGEEAEMAEEIREERPHPPPRPPKRNQKSSVLWKALFPCSLVLAASLLLAVFFYRTSWLSFRSGADSLTGNRFFSGLTVDGTDVGGMTYGQAEDVLTGISRSAGEEVRLTILIGEATAEFSSAHISYSRNVGDALDQAYAVGRSWDASALEAGNSPFEERLRSVRGLREKGLAFASSAAYRREDVAAFAAALARQTDTPPVSAKLRDVDFVHRVFSYTEDQSGLMLDQENLVSQICAALDEGAAEKTIRARMSYAPPAVRRTDLMNRFGLMNVRAVPTVTRAGDAALKALVKALNGVVIQSGDQISFHSVLKQAGYTLLPFEEDPLPTQIASALMEGGLCAGMTLKARSPLKEKSALIPPGTEAAISGSGDMILANDSGAPACVLCYYTPRTSAGTAGDVTIEWYGLTLNPGEEVALAAEKTGETKPGEPVTVLNDALPPGRKFLKQEQAAGEDWTCCLVYTHSGREYRRETVFTTSYPARERIIEYNDKGAQP